MGEVLPLAAGILVGVIAMYLSVSNRTRIVLLAMISITFGAVATLVNHEELFFMPIDIAIVGLSAGAALAVARRRGRAGHMRTNPRSVSQSLPAAQD